MPYTLIGIPPEHLRTLAQALIPPTLVHAYASDALPPDFVAARALVQIEAGSIPYSHSTFYILDTERNCIVGSCGFKDPPQQSRVEIGYGISAGCRK